jgi:hypothetical protein
MTVPTIGLSISVYDGEVGSIYLDSDLPIDLDITGGVVNGISSTGNSVITIKGGKISYISHDDYSGMSIGELDILGGTIDKIYLSDCSSYWDPGYIDISGDAYVKSIEIKFGGWDKIVTHIKINGGTVDCIDFSEDMPPPIDATDLDFKLTITGGKVGLSYNIQQCIEKGYITANIDYDNAEITYIN